MDGNDQSGSAPSDAADPGPTRPGAAARAADRQAANLVAGRYRLQRELGRGGHGSVHVATDEALGRIVAIKLLHSRVNSERLAREAQALARLQHAHVVRVHDAGTQGDTDYLVMEHVDGPTLAQLLTKGPLPWREAVRIVRDVSSALAHAVDQGVLHRDIKPGNILLANGRDVRVADFGIARLAGVAPVTSTGVHLGTIAYMAPEIFEAGERDERSEVYAVGAVLCECVIGATPFRAETTEDLIGRILRSAREPLPEDASWPAALALLIDECLSRDPDLRPGTLAALEARLRDLIPEAPAPRAGVEIPAALRVTASAAPPAGERRRVPLMFIEERYLDDLAERGDGTSLAAARAQILAPVFAIIERHGGLVAEIENDGILAMFGLPRVHEADAASALACARELVDARTRGKVDRLAARIAVALDADHVESGGAGAQPRIRNLSRRTLRQLAASAGDGDIAQGESLRATFRQRPPFARDREGDRAPGPPPIGRDAELALLKQGIDAAFAGRGLAITLEGPAGIGKSHVLETALDLATLHAAHPIIVSAEAIDDASLAPGHVAADLGRSLLRDEAIARGLDEMERRRLTEPVGAETELSAREHEEAQRAAWAKAFRNAAPRCMVLAIENLHACDAASLRLIERIAQMIPRLPVLLLATTRPGSGPSWAGRPFHRPIVLPPLPPDSLEAILNAAFPAGPPEHARVLIDTAEGNPFFLLELARAARRRAASSASDAPLPASVGAVLAEHLDRLPRPLRELLQAGAVIGRDFSVELAASALNTSLLDARERAEHLASRDDLVASHVGDEEAYSFPHALLRAAARDSLAEHAARALHGRVAAALEARGALPEDLGWHWSRSTEKTRAIPHLGRSARRARAAGSLDDAVRHAEHALALAEAGDLPDRELASHRLAAAECHAWAGHVGRAVESARAVAEGAESADDAELELEARLALAQCLALGSDAAAILPHLDRAGRLALEQGDREAQAAVAARRAETLLTLERGAEAKEALAALDALSPADPQRRLDACKLAAIIAYNEGRSLDALEAASAGLALAREIGDRLRALRFLSQRATVRTVLGPVHEAMAAAKEFLAEAEAIGIVETQAYALVVLAHLRRTAAEPAEAERLARRAEQLAIDIDHRRRQMLALVQVAQACLDGGATGASQSAAEAALELATSLGAHGQARQASMVLAQIAADAGDASAAIASVRAMSAEATQDADLGAQLACSTLQAELQSRLGSSADLVALAEICEQQARTFLRPADAAEAVVAAALARASIGTEFEACLALALADGAIRSAEDGGFILLGLRARLARCQALHVLGDARAAAEGSLLVSETAARGLVRLEREARRVGLAATS